METGKTYRFRVSNVGLAISINFRIQGHDLLLVETEGDHTIQNTYSSLDVHLGQSYSVLVTADQAPQDYHIVASTRFTSQVLTTTAVLHYSNSAASVSGAPPGGPTTEIDWSLNQARSVRLSRFPSVALRFLYAIVKTHKFGKTDLRLITWLEIVKLIFELKEMGLSKIHYDIKITLVVFS